MTKILEPPKPGAGLWGLGLVASGSAHVAILAVVLPFMRPDSVPQQTSPKSELSIESQQVTRSQALEKAPAKTPGKQSQPQADALNAGAIQELTAPATSPTLQAITSIQSRGDQITTQAMPSHITVAHNPTAQAALASPLASQPAPEQPIHQQPVSARPAIPDPVSIRPATAQPIVPQPNTAPRIATQKPDFSSTPSKLPALDTVRSAPPISATVNRISPHALASTAPVGIAPNQTLAEITTEPQELPPSLPQSEVLTAFLAFQGNGSEEIDPTSVDAFQSFTRPGDLSGQTDGLRDGLSGLLNSVPCARLQVAFDPNTATLELRGHLPEDALREPVLAALQAQIGRDIALSDKMRLLPRPLCGALTGIASVGLPQSTDQITNPLLLGEDAQARILAYSGGEQLFFDLIAPDYPAYLYVDYFDAAGDVIHLSPLPGTMPTLTEPKSAQRVGSRTADEPGLQIIIGPPYGQEIAVAFSTSSQLYDVPRPLIEPAAAYLEFLQEKITETRDQHTDFKGEWVYFLIETHAD